MSSFNISEAVNTLKLAYTLWDLSDALGFESIAEIHQALIDRMPNASIRYDREYLMRRFNFDEEELHCSHCMDKQDVSRKLKLVYRITQALLLDEAYDYGKEF